MSVPASQRPQSKAEFVIRARELLIYSIKKSKGLEKSMTFFGKQSLYETAQKIHEDVVRGNSIYPTCREDVLARHEHFRDARARLGRKNHNYGQGIDRMKTVIKKITAEARFKGKDLVIEDLDFSSRKSDLQRNKNYNRMISQLAYGQYTQAVKRRCFKDNVDLKIVDPAYTSKKAEETVCREYGINVHLGAACMIARRGLGLF